MKTERAVLENKDMANITSGSPSRITYSYSYVRPEPPSRGEVLDSLQKMRERIHPDDKEFFEQAISSYSESMAIIINLQIKLEDMSETLSRIFNSSYEVVRAIEDSGSHPEYHNNVLKKHKRQWPLLWSKIEKMSKEVNREISKNL